MPLYHVNRSVRPCILSDEFPSYHVSFIQNLVCPLHNLLNVVFLISLTLCIELVVYMPKKVSMRYWSVIARCKGRWILVSGSGDEETVRSPSAVQDNDGSRSLAMSIGYVSTAARPGQHGDSGRKEEMVVNIVNRKTYHPFIANNAENV